METSLVDAPGVVATAVVPLQGSPGGGTDLLGLFQFSGTVEWSNRLPAHTRCAIGQPATITTTGGSNFDGSEIHVAT